MTAAMLLLQLKLNSIMNNFFKTFSERLYKILHFDTVLKRSNENFLRAFFSLYLRKLFEIQIITYNFYAKS